MISPYKNNTGIDLRLFKCDCAIVCQTSQMRLQSVSVKTPFIKRFHLEKTCRMVAISIVNATTKFKYNVKILLQTVQHEKYSLHFRVC